MVYESAFQSPTPSAPFEPTIRRTNHRTLWIFLLILIGALTLLGVATGYSGFFTKPNEGKTVIRNVDLSGTLLLTLVHTKEEPRVSALYQYTFSDASVERLGWDLVAYDGIELTSMYSESPNEEWTTFIGLRGREADQPPLSARESSWQIYRANYTLATTPDDLVKTLQEAERVTNDDDSKSGAIVSDTGAILYTALSENLSPSEPVAVETGMIQYVAEGSSNARTLTEGMDPEWIGASSFAFLKNDGLYVYSLADGTEKKLWNLPTPVTTRRSIGVSGDGILIALADNEAAELLILRIPSIDSEVELVTTLPIKGSYPVFSPDGNRIALISVALKDESDEQIPAITVYDVSSSEQRAAIPLVGFNAATAYITDWFF